MRRPEQQPGTLSGTGEMLWDLLAEPRTIAQLAAELHEIYAAPVDEIIRDLEPVLVRLVDVGIVRTSANDGTSRT